MPDSHGNFKGMSVPAAAWERIFGKPRYLCEELDGGLDIDHRNTAGVDHDLDCHLNRDKRPADR